MKVDKKLEKILREAELEGVIALLEEDCRIPVASFDDLSFMQEINDKTDYYARLDASTDYIIID